jgi:hypothetical protein
MVTIEFLKDYATKKKGDTMQIDSMVASDLIKKKVVKVRLRKTKKEE